VLSDPNPVAAECAEAKSIAAVLADTNPVAVGRAEAKSLAAVLADPNLLRRRMAPAQLWRPRREMVA
jgi:hypothetical protein